MEIKNLRYFLAVAREENMSKAAEQLHVSQPTLSKTLKALEEELGKKLFIRHSFSISLTDEGMLLRDRAQDLVAMSDKIEQEFNSLDDITGGDIYFGLAESYQIRYLAREIYKLKEKYPNFTYHITSGDTEQVTEKLDKGILDFAVLCETPDSNKYEYVKFPEADVWGAIISSSHPLAKKKSIHVSDLIGQPLFVSEQSWNNEIKTWARERFPKLKLEGSFRLSYNGSVFARENLGILLTFKDLINTEGTDMVFRPLSPELKSELYLIWNKYQAFTPIAEKFLEQIKKTFK
ncbi:MAG: LysR family transcriptional regulator [Baileyella intestinalis]|uniref:LysR family transcriptional regulator n=1 Tax=Baileyella intestinalis TaxID=2606709 RepID=UPI002A7549D9|nr:LysR family transcriptional regulator [Baileyella intestinalis]MDY2995487.1 LysR family transcriptional regulator [Baileyella intestinalis]